MAIEFFKQKFPKSITNKSFRQSAQEDKNKRNPKIKSAQMSQDSGGNDKKFTLKYQT
jgi:hypothetical protein